MKSVMNFGKACAVACLSVCIFSCSSRVREAEIRVANEIRPPAVPLVTVDPYFSIWSFADNAFDRPTVHWTGKEHPLIGAVRVDGVSYRLLGRENPHLVPVLPTIVYEPWTAKVMIDRKPSGDWTSPDYDDNSWETVPGAIGSPEMPVVRTIWRGDDRDIWVRRTIELSEDLSGKSLVLEYSHDDVFELYINGIEVANTGNTWRNNVRVELPEEVRKTLTGGKVTFAAHCHNTVGGSYVDFGLFEKCPGGEFENIAEQTGLSVLPTRTVYTFECGNVEIDMIFTAPLLMDDLDLMSRPVNYLTYQVRSTDGKKHSVQVYFEGTPRIALNTPDQDVTLDSGIENGINYLRTGTVGQNILGRKGDDVRIDWGYFYMAVPDGKGELAAGDYVSMKESFMDTGDLSGRKEVQDTLNILRTPVSMAYARDLGNVGPEKVCDYLMLAYDDIYSVQFFGENLRPYWNRDGMTTIVSMLEKASDSYAGIMEKCESFDVSMMNDAVEAGGKEYSELCALAYRQAIAAHKLVESPDGELLFLSKENFSNGSIGTVDVTYPSAPLFLLYNPELAKGLMNHIFHYSESGRWTKPFAAHDVGTYPIANGQTYGGDMPVEESGNMLILTAAVAEREGNAGYASLHWDVLSVWADYLVEHGLDPANQLCTDDFAGHFAHNANLSIKAIMGVASYSRLAGMLGKTEIEKKYRSAAEEMASKWKTMAFDGDHYKLTFDKPGTWSQKYNLVWDDILDFGIFDDSVAETEIAYYLTKQNEYGLPLDSRKTYTKTDWIMWTATLADDKETFMTFVHPVWKFMNETPDRVPMCDWVYTDSDRKVGFQARSVVGGYFIKML